MKAIKTFLAPKSNVCQYCKAFMLTRSADGCCSPECARKLEWVTLSKEQSLRIASQSPAAPPDPDSVIRRALMESAARSGHNGTHAETHMGGQSSFDTERDHPPLARNRSMPERRRHRVVSHHTPRTPPPTILSFAGNTPAGSLQPLRLPDEPSSYRRQGSIFRSERRSERTGTGERSGASSPTLSTSSPTSSSPTLVSHPPVPVKQRDAKTTAPAIPKSQDSSAPSRVGRHTKSASVASAAPTSSPASHHVFPVVSSGEPPQSATKSNAQGSAVKPFLARTPSHALSRTNRKLTLDADSPPAPKSLTRPSPEPASIPPAHAPPHPRYRNGALGLRPGYGRREPRPRSNSFGGFMKAFRS
ncbi:hypothetical protein K466DRAFT_604029 [Polyporus arcularius HHB13444]|uniref:Uncharacterized protein n=1 Tax=Polyporus arcularius HHB13444 TaxID=1314778 RepID=A0A5C3NXK3_9APHY|nr:hypothetical protein K466DRAFT_604029 [Polyporus arcularius HHB13444]